MTGHECVAVGGLFAAGNAYDLTDLLMVLPVILIPAGGRMRVLGPLAAGVTMILTGPMAANEVYSGYDYNTVTRTETCSGPR